MVVEQQASFLIDIQNSDGGWGPTKGRISQTEATALAVLAMDEVGGKVGVAAAASGRSWLERMQRPDGSWPRSSDVSEPSWMTSLAMIALVGEDWARPKILKSADWLLGFEGKNGRWLHRTLVRLGIREDLNSYDTRLHGWPWVPGTFGWVEPTSYGLLAIKKIFPYLPSGRARHRVEDAQMMLLDRMCPGGGWNYGTSNTLGVDLPPFPDTTALALIGLQAATPPRVATASLSSLRGMLGETASGLSLALSIICFRLFSLEVEDLKRRLADTWQTTGFNHETRPIALSILAMQQGAPSFSVMTNA